jgi:hypothetical protein
MRNVGMFCSIARKLKLSCYLMQKLAFFEYFDFLKSHFLCDFLQDGGFTLSKHQPGFGGGGVNGYDGLVANIAR